MKRYPLALVATVMLISGLAIAQEGYDSETSWVLLGLDWENGGGVAVRNMSEEADVSNVGPAPLFRTQRACQAAMRHAIQKFSGRSHADGGGGYYLCSQLRNWTIAM